MFLTGIWVLNILKSRKEDMIIQKIFLLPVSLRLTAKEGDVIVFSASTKEEKTSGLMPKFTKTVAGKIPRDSFINCLRNAAQQFVEKRGGKTLLIAGYPWFGAWGRDTFISLPGLALARHRLALYRDVLDTQVERMKNGLFPNMGNLNNPAFNSVDAPLWFFWAVQHYVENGGT